MKEKYIDEAVGFLTIFGWGEDGTVDVMSQHGDVFTGVSEEQAKRICKANQEYREKLYDIFKAVK